jgi:hypothetical protein
MRLVYSSRSQIQVEITKRLDYGYACCHSVRNLSSSRLSKKHKNLNTQDNSERGSAWVRNMVSDITGGRDYGYLRTGC